VSVKSIKITPRIVRTAIGKTLEKTMNEEQTIKQPGVCVTWEEAKTDWTPIKGDEELVRKVWEENDLEAYMFLWQCVLSF
jgi:hypothetical protein